MVLSGGGSGAGAGRRLERRAGVHNVHAGVRTADAVQHQAEIGGSIAGATPVAHRRRDGHLEPLVVVVVVLVLMLMLMLALVLVPMGGQVEATLAEKLQAAVARFGIQQLVDGEQVRLVGAHIGGGGGGGAVRAHHQLQLGVLDVRGQSGRLIAGTSAGRQMEADEDTIGGAGGVAGTSGGRVNGGLEMVDGPLDAPLMVGW